MSPEEQGTAPHPGLARPAASARARRARLLNRLAAVSSADTTAPPRRSAPGEPVPASPGQQGLWFIEQFDGGTAQYTVPFAFRFRGKLVVPALARALDGAVARQAALRTTFVENDGEPLQKVGEPSPVPLPVEDLTALPAQEREAELHQRLDAEAERVFDLAAGPLFVASLLTLDEDDHVLLLTVHHIAFDGWSLGILVEELGELYADAVAGRDTHREAPALQYTDYAVWQRDWLRGEECRAQYAYWRHTLRDVPALELPTDRPRPAEASHDGDCVRFELSEERLAEVVRVSAEERVTPFMFLLAVFQTVLARATGQRDIAVGTPVANRALPGTQQLIGCFVNSVVLRTDLSGDITFRELLRRVRDVALGAYENQNYPFSDLVAKLVPHRDSSRSPLFQVMFVMHEESWTRADWPGLVVEPVELPTRTCSFDVTLYVTTTARGILGELDFRTDLFDKSGMERLAREFQQTTVWALDRLDDPVDTRPALL
ncbi:condensation domain-containing protein [Streptomyces demainii]|uniref:Non-ribosomal peptide synthetase component F n=1 Tax=Streptomyces demainii TaxID=588122 RepID=A0ABT9LA99_9ACTN|nr:condensation domain-containing protein [Streptomyces demainii]MDP9616461.1 non-ribosomal peptide synthetase component F [Streptomyces demainii]